MLKATRISTCSVQTYLNAFALPLLLTQSALTADLCQGFNYKSRNIAKPDLSIDDQVSNQTSRIQPNTNTKKLPDSSSTTAITITAAFNDQLFAGRSTSQNCSGLPAKIASHKPNVVNQEGFASQRYHSQIMDRPKLLIKPSGTLIDKQEICSLARAIRKYRDTNSILSYGPIQRGDIYCCSINKLNDYKLNGWIRTNNFSI